MRGAFEQFNGSPYLRNDRSQLYEQLLADAFHETTTIYRQQGRTQVAAASDELTEGQNNQQAHQLRGMIVKDLRDYVAARTEDERQRLVGSAIGFQMGLVFRIRGSSNARPLWLDHALADPDTSRRSVSDRRRVPMRPADHAESARTFNVVETNFSDFPPRFERVRQYSDASTIAITWDLIWMHVIPNAML